MNKPITLIVEGSCSDTAKRKQINKEKANTALNTDVNYSGISNPKNTKTPES